MTRHRWKIVAVLAAALAVLGGSVAWSVSSNGGMGSHMGRSAWMAGYLPKNATVPVKTFDDATHNAQAFADRLGLKVDEVLQFDRNYYVKLVDTKGNGATEVLVDPPSGAVSIEYGPAMMWNTRYGFHTGRYATGMMRGVKGYGSMMGSSRGGNGHGSMMGDSGNGSMMGGGSHGPMMGNGMANMMGVQSQSTPSRVSIDQARTLVQRYLDANEAGVTVETGGDSFPGYFTFEILRSAQITGMVSVQASTGAVWPHWWHGAFVASA